MDLASHGAMAKRTPPRRRGREADPGSAPGANESAVAAAEDDGTPVANVHHDLFAVVGSDRPAHQGRIEAASF